MPNPEKESNEELGDPELEKKMEKRILKLKKLDDEYNGAVTRLMWRIGHIIKDYTSICEEILKKRDEKIKREKGSESAEMIDAMKQVKKIKDINKDTIKEMEKAEEEQNTKLDKLLSSIPPKLKGELEKD